MSTWFRFESTTPDHPKVAKLARKLGVTRVQALGHLTCLWARVCAAAPDGDLTSYDADDLAVFASWEGDEGLLVEALEGARLIDPVHSEDGEARGYELHGWWERAEGHKRAKAARDRRAKTPRAARAPGASVTCSARDPATGPRGQTGQTDTPRTPPAGGLPLLDGEPPLAPSAPAAPRGKPPAKKGPRAAWWWRAAQAAGRGEVEQVLAAYRRHHPQARPGELERGLIAERLMGDEPPFAPAQLVEAVDGCHVSEHHVSEGYTGLELIVRDRAKVEQFRRLLEASKKRGGGRRPDEAGEAAWAEVRAALGAWARREPVDLSPMALAGLRACGGSAALRQADERGMARLRAEFLAGCRGVRA